MIIVTSEHVVGYRVAETKGQVFGLVVRSRGLGGNIMAGLRSLGGGESQSTQSCLKKHAATPLIEWYRTLPPWVPMGS